MLPTIKFVTIRRFGKTQFHPDCQISNVLCEISNKKSLTETNISMLIMLDIFKIETKAHEDE